MYHKSRSDGDSNNPFSPTVVSMSSGTLFGSSQSMGSLRSAPSIHDTLPKMIRELYIELTPNDTVFYHLVILWNNNCCINNYKIKCKRYYLSNLILILLISLLLLKTAFDWIFNADVIVLVSSLYNSISTPIFGIIVCIAVIFSCNITIVKEACKSFPFRYQIIHAGIADIARYWYHNFWKGGDYEDDGPINYALAVTHTIFLMLLIGTISVMDGYYSDNIARCNRSRVCDIDTKKTKRIYMICCIFFFIWYFICFFIFIFETVSQ